MKIVKRFNDWVNKPNSINTTAEMIVKIEKGETKGSAWVPCTFETLSYGVDINPALIKKKKVKKQQIVKEKIKKLPVNKMFMVHKKIGEEIELDDDEEFEEYKEEKCSHCNQPIIIAKVKAVKYRSCPIVTVELSVPAKQDTYIPVTYGFDKYSIYKQFVFLFLIPAMTILFFLTVNYSENNMRDTILLSSISLFTNLYMSAKIYRLAKWVKTYRTTWKPYKDDIFENNNI